jgi:hypothetical protein
MKAKIVSRKTTVTKSGPGRLEAGVVGAAADAVAVGTAKADVGAAPSRALPERTAGARSSQSLDLSNVDGEMPTRYGKPGSSTRGRDGSRCRGRPRVP